MFNCVYNEIVLHRIFLQVAKGGTPGISVRDSLIAVCDVTIFTEMNRETPPVPGSTTFTDKLSKRRHSNAMSAEYICMDVTYLNC